MLVWPCFAGPLLSESKMYESQIYLQIQGSTVRSLCNQMFREKVVSSIQAANTSFLLLQCQFMEIAAFFFAFLSKKNCPLMEIHLHKTTFTHITQISLYCICVILSWLRAQTNLKKKNRIMSFLILKMGFWRPLYVIAGNVYYHLSRRPLVYKVSLLCCGRRTCALKYYQQMIKKKKIMSISSPLPCILY